MDFDKLIYIGENEILYMGRIDKISVHSHITWTLCICIEGGFEFRSDNFNTRVDTSALIPPGFQHEIEGNSSLILFIFFEKYSNFLSTINLRFPITILKDDIYKEISHNFQSILELKMDSIRSVIKYNINLLNIQLYKKSNIDERIIKIIQFLNLNRNEKQISIPELSSMVHLSESRLSHLFKEEIGIPISSYRIWIKIKHLAQSLESGKSLTFAAQEAGFYDSSHFNRVFKNYFGLNPKKVFMNSKIKWIYGFSKI